MMLGKMAEKLTEEMADLGDQRRRERENVDESELYEIDFTVSLEKKTFKFIGVIFCFLFLASFKALLKEHFAILILWIAFFLFMIVVTLILWLKPSPHVVRNGVIYKKRTYHYREITEIRVSSIEVAKVYAGKRKLFTITGDYVNYDRFLSWAEKCRIPIHKNPEKDFVTEQKENQLKFLIGVFVAVAIIMAVILPLITAFLADFY